MSDYIFFTIIKGRKLTIYCGKESSHFLDLFFTVNFYSYKQVFVFKTYHRKIYHIIA